LQLNIKQPFQLSFYRQKLKHLLVNSNTVKNNKLI